MAFLKIPLPRRGNDKVASAVPRESAEAMRQRAKHRLIGAAVLVLIGIVGFPLVFDTQPRPIAVDVPIVIPDKNSAKPLVMPSQPTQPSGSGSGKTSSAAPAAPAATNPPVPPAASLAAKEEVVPDTPAAQANADQPPPAAPKAEPKPQAAPKVAKADTKADAKPAESKPRESKSAEADKPAPSKSAQAKADAAARASDAARAEALLDGKSAAAVATSNVSGRFVVQVGAFADAAKARETRQKLEKAGLKSYTQVVQTKDGPRTRVRVGPFTSRADADRAAGRLKGLEMPASVLSL